MNTPINDDVSFTKLHRGIASAVVAAGIALRFANLGRQSLWFDEGYSAWAVSNPARQLIRIISVDTAPPLYYLLLRGWALLFGFSETALRSLSALMASVALLVFAGIARRLLKSPWAATLAICLFAFSFMQIAYAHEARFYAMMTMMAAIDLHLVLLMCDRSTSGRLIAIAITWSISLWTNNVMAVYLLCLGIAWMILPGKRKFAGRMRDGAIVTAGAGISFAPWLPTMLAQTRRIQGAFWPSTPDFALLMRTLSVLAGVNEQSLFGHGIGGFKAISDLILTLVVIAYVYSKTNQLPPQQEEFEPQRRRGAEKTGGERRRIAISLIAFGIGPILIIFAYSLVSQPIFMERAFLASGVAIPLLVVLPMECLGWPRIFSFGSALLLLALSLRSIPGHRLGEHAENWRDASAYAQSSQAAHRLIVCVSSDGEPLYRYYGCHGDYSPRTDVTAVPASFFALDPPRTMRQVKSDEQLDPLRALLATGRFEEIVLLESHTYYGDHTERTLGMLRAELRQVDERVFTGIKVYRFTPS